MLRYLTTTGIVFYFILYGVSASRYPGGNQIDHQEAGFSWAQNYGCNLFNEQALNGQINPARPFAILANLILCVAIAWFFVRYGSKHPVSKKWSRITQIAGVFSMFFASILFTRFHDITSILSGIFGVIALWGVYMGLQKDQQYSLIRYGFICFILIAVNNAIYFSEKGIYYLPVIQKITLVVILSWVVLVENGMATSIKNI